MVGAILGVGSVVGLRSDLGWAIGLLAGGAVGGLGSWLAAKRVLREATACLVALGNDGDRPEEGGHGSDGGGSLPVLGSEAFDAWIAHLHRVLEHFKQIRSEHAGALRLARQLQAAMIGPEGANNSSARSDPERDGTVQSLRILLDQFRQAGVPINRDLSALEEANERVASGAQDQSEAVSRTATSVEALSDRIDRIAHTCRRGGRRLRARSSRGPPGARPGAQRHRRHGPAPDPDRGQRPQGPPTGGPIDGDRRDRRPDSRHLQPHRHARPQRHDRIDPRRGTWPRLRGHRRGDPQAGRADRRGHPRDQHARRGHPVRRPGEHPGPGRGTGPDARQNRNGSARPVARWSGSARSRSDRPAWSRGSPARPGIRS